MNLSDFMLNLAKDPNALTQFQQDPQGSMTKAGLSTDEIAAVTSKDPGTIQNAIKAKGGPGGAWEIVIVVVLRN